MEKKFKPGDKVYHKNLKALFLAHISENTNTKECAFNEAMKVLNQIDPNTKCYVEALGYIPTNLYDISKECIDEVRFLISICR